jgi:hypothetical protein
MSDAGDFVLKCRRRGVQIRCEKDEVVLFGTKPDVEELTAELQPLVNDVLHLCGAWMQAAPPTRRLELH